MAIRASDNGTVRDDAPAANDFALVVRPIGGGSTGVASPTTGVVTSVAASLVSVTLLAANAARAGFSIRNASNGAVLYILANTTGGPASLTNNTVMVFPNGYYEDPYNYVGEVFGIWGPGVGVGETAQVTEYVPVP